MVILLCIFPENIDVAVLLHKTDISRSHREDIKICWPLENDRMSTPTKCIRIRLVFMTELRDAQSSPLKWLTFFMFLLAPKNYGGDARAERGHIFCSVMH